MTRAATSGCPLGSRLLPTASPFVSVALDRTRGLGSDADSASNAAHRPIDGVSPLSAWDAVAMIRALLQKSVTGKPSSSSRTSVEAVKRLRKLLLQVAQTDQRVELEGLEGLELERIRR